MSYEGEDQEFHRKLGEALSVHIAAAKERILAGNFLGLELYQRQCGVLEGLERALTVADEIRHPVRDDFEEAEL